MHINDGMALSSTSQNTSSSNPLHTPFFHPNASSSGQRVIEWTKQSVHLLVFLSSTGVAALLLEHVLLVELLTELNQHTDCLVDRRNLRYPDHKSASIGHTHLSHCKRHPTDSKLCNQSLKCGITHRCNRIGRRCLCQSSFQVCNICLRSVQS